MCGCRGVTGSSVSTGGARTARYLGKVKIVALTEPVGAAQLGVVEAHGSRPIDEVALELEKQVADLGGNVAKVDSVKTKFEMVTQTESYTYSCGSKGQTCTGTRTVQREVSTVSMVGRAFKKEN